MLIIKSQEQFEHDVLSANKLVAAYFYAEWVAPCKKMMSLIDELDNEQNEYYVAKINIDDVPCLLDKYHISSIPTILVFWNGDYGNRIVGITNKNEINRLVQSLIK